MSANVSLCRSTIPAKCNPAGTSGKPNCQSSVCESNGECITNTFDKLYTDCVGPEGLPFLKEVPAECICRNHREDSAVIDVFLLNETKETLNLIGLPLTWVTLRSGMSRCDLSFWQITPPPSVGPGKPFFARAFSGDHTRDTDCKHDSKFYMCLTYGVDGSSANSVTINMCRQRSGSGGSRCNNYDGVDGHKCQQSKARGNLTVKIKNNGGRRGSYLFTVTGGGEGPPGGGCISNPDNCPAGLYCQTAEPPNSCITGCKVIPDSCTASDEVCDPTSRVCITTTTCNTTNDCDLDFFCNKDKKCAPGCVNSDHCSGVKTCVRGQCTAKTPDDGGPSRTLIILYVVVGIVGFLVIVGGIVYFIYESRRKT